MTPLECYELVNKCETYEELGAAIRSIADDNGMIQGKVQQFDAGKMANFAEEFVSGRANCLTRAFGIRQQALYIYFYESFDEEEI